MYKEKMDYLKYGGYASNLLLHGAVHLDFKLDNLGLNSAGCIVALDFSNVLSFNFPHEFTLEIINKSAISLLEFTEALKNSFTLHSYFRAGYILNAGFAGLTVYDKLYSFNYSSFLYTKTELCETDRNCIDTTNMTEIKEILAEWNDIPFEKVILYENVIDYKTCSIRNRIKYPINQYYLDNTYFIYNSMRDFLEGDINQKETAERMLFISESALKSRRFYTAYGLARRYKLISKNESVHNMCDRIISKTQEYISKYSAVVEEYLNIDIFELIWLLEDLDMCK